MKKNNDFANIKCLTVDMSDQIGSVFSIQIDMLDEKSDFMIFLETAFEIDEILAGIDKNKSVFLEFKKSKKKHIFTANDLLNNDILFNLIDTIHRASEGNSLVINGFTRVTKGKDMNIEYFENSSLVDKECALCSHLLVNIEIPARYTGSVYMCSNEQCAAIVTDDAEFKHYSDKEIDIMFSARGLEVVDDNSKKINKYKDLTEEPCNVCEKEKLTIRKIYSATFGGKSQLVVITCDNCGNIMTDSIFSDNKDEANNVTDMINEAILQIISAYSKK